MMLRNPAIATLLCICCTLPAFCQEAYIFGKVKDAKTYELLPGVAITAGDSAGTITDLNGSFKLKLKPGNYRINFKFLGYDLAKRNVDLKDGSFKEFNISLEPSSEQLDIVVVSASQYEKSIAQETVPMEVLNAKIIENNNSRDLGEVLSKTPGVQVQDAQITIRGGSSYSYGVGSRTAVLVDGMTFLSADLGDAKLKLAPLEDVERVEVIKGASSVIYGSSALNGAVNMITGWPKTGEKMTQTTFYAGAYQPLDESDRWTSSIRGFSGLFFNHRQRIGNLQLMVGGNVDYISSYMEKADEFRVRGSFKTKYNPPNNNKISYGLNGIIMKEVSDRFFISQDLDSFAYQQGAGSHDEYLESVVDPHFTYRDAKGNRFAFRGRYLNVFRDGNPKNDTLVNYIDTPGSTLDSVYVDHGVPNASANTMSIDLQYQKNWKDLFILTVGTPVTYTNSISNLYAEREKTLSAAGYVQGEFKIQKLSLVGGMRYEITKVDTVFEKSKPVFRFGANYQFGKASFVRASWGQGYRLASIAERFLLQQFTAGIYVLPNPDLQVETAWNLEMGLKQGFRIKSWKAFLDISGFWSRYFELVEYVFGIYPNVAPDGSRLVDTLGTPYLFAIKPFNVEDAKIFGWEVSIVGEGKIGPIGISVLAGYTYVYPGNLESDTAQQDVGVFLKNAFKYYARHLEGEEANSVLQFRQRHLLRGDLEFSYKKYSVGVSLFYNSFFEKIPALYSLAVATIEGANDRPPTLEKFISEHEGGDFVADLRFGYDFNDKIKILFFLKNIANKEYAVRPGKMDPPRTYSLQIRVRF